MKNEYGITLPALVIIVAIMIIIISVSLRGGTESVNNTLLNGFYTQLEIIQERVDDISTTNESYINEDGTEIYIKEAGKDLTETQINNLKAILLEQGPSTDYIKETYRYFTIQDIKDILDLDEIDYNLFIDFENRIIIAEGGITIGSTTYYMLGETKYHVKENSSKNEGTINSLIYGTPIQYTADTYKLSIEPENTIGDLDKSGYIKYKKMTSNYWETTTSNELILKLNTKYNIKFTDLNNNSIEKIIKIEYKKDEEGNLVPDEQNNNILIVTEVTEEESGEF